APSPREGHAMAYDPVNRVVVLFGGIDLSSGALNVLNDTWIWNGGDWVQLAPVTSPPARSGHGMVYDAALQQTILFGGNGSVNATLNDTWTWDGSNWVKRNPAQSPGP